jgi:limonene-1,2-epoxide hydrolase
MNQPKEVVMSYIKALDSQDYDAATGYLSDNVRVTGPAGEMFRKPREFVDMLRLYRGKYDLKKIFTDGDDVCLLYDLKTPQATVFMCSWYQVKDGKIASVRSVFDPRPFGPPPGKQSG